jgi:hypothetical protein
MDYTESIVAAEQMLREFGATAKLTVSSGDPTYNVETATSTASTTQVMVSAVVFPLDKGRMAMMKSQVTGDDQQMLLAARDQSGVAVPVPRVSDVVEFASKRYTVVEVAPLAPAGDPILYDCVVR